MNRETYFSSDEREFLFLLAKYKVRYLIVGGEAVIYYGYARLTGDIDFWYENGDDNVRNLFTALRQFWKNDVPGITDANELKRRGMIFQFGIPPHRIDLMNAIEGVVFSAAWKRKEAVRLTFKKKTFMIYYIGINDLKSNKRRVNRDKDRDDLRFLSRVKK